MFNFPNFNSCVGEDDSCFNDYSCMCNSELVMQNEWFKNWFRLCLAKYRFSIFMLFDIRESKSRIATVSEIFLQHPNGINTRCELFVMIFTLSERVSIFVTSKSRYNRRTQFGLRGCSFYSCLIHR